MTLCHVQGDPAGDPEAASGARAGLSADTRKSPAEPHAADRTASSQVRTCHKPSTGEQVRWTQKTNGPNACSINPPRLSQVWFWMEDSTSRTWLELVPQTEKRLQKPSLEMFLSRAWSRVVFMTQVFRWARTTAGPSCRRLSLSGQVVLKNFLFVWSVLNNKS